MGLKYSFISVDYSKLVSRYKICCIKLTHLSVLIYLSSPGKASLKKKYLPRFGLDWHLLGNFTH